MFAKTAIMSMVVLVLAVADVSAAVDRPIGDFYGRYVGQSISGEATSLSARDLSVTIRAHERGFVIDWTTVILKSGGKTSRKSYSILFHPTKRRHIYRSLMARDPFGNLVPLDPLRGQPYVWARVLGNTLSVFMMLITDDGGYDMHAYHRTLTAGGMKLRFTQQHGDMALKVIRGRLKKTGG
jgi:hypothetical protein